MKLTEKQIIAHDRYHDDDNEGWLTVITVDTNIKPDGHSIIELGFIKLQMISLNERVGCNDIICRDIGVVK